MHVKVVPFDDFLGAHVCLLIRSLSFDLLSLKLVNVSFRLHFGFGFTMVSIFQVTSFAWTMSCAIGSLSPRLAISYDGASLLFFSSSSLFPRFFMHLLFYSFLFCCWCCCCCWCWGCFFFSFCCCCFFFLLVLLLMSSKEDLSASWLFVKPLSFDFPPTFYHASKENRVSTFSRLRILTFRSLHSFVAITWRPEGAGEGFG